MEKLSRVKKYEDLRKSIELDNHVDSPLTEEETSALNTSRGFDSTLLKRVAISDGDEETDAKRAKQDDGLHDAAQSKHDISDTFTNEYLDDFIREVREYNIRKGNRESEDTQADILYQLNSTNRAKRSHYVQEINEELEEIAPVSNVMSKDEIVAEVQNLLREDPPNEEVEATTDFADESNSIYDTQSLSYVAASQQEADESPVRAAAFTEDAPMINQRFSGEKKIIQPVFDDAFEDEEQDERQDTAMDSTKSPLHKKLIEETQQLRVQMDEYEDELTDLSDGVQKTNKLLNFVLCFLILVLLIIIGFIVYSLWKAGGI